MSDDYHCPVHGYQIGARCCSLALRLLSVPPPQVGYLIPGESIIVPNPDGSLTSFTPTGPPLTVTDVDRARGTITVTAEESMTDGFWELADAVAVEMICIDAADMHIPPDEMRPRVAQWKAVGDPQWFAAQRSAANALIALEKLGYTVAKHDPRSISAGVAHAQTLTADELPQVIAVANDKLRPGDPRKITRTLVKRLRETAYTAADGYSGPTWLADLADALSSYLLPEGTEP